MLLMTHRMNEYIYIYMDSPISYSRSVLHNQLCLFRLALVLVLGQMTGGTLRYVARSQRQQQQL